MKDCIFCKIVKGKVPSYKVYEDENFLAFLDVNPQTAGHVQVVPKDHYRWVWDVPNIGEYFKVVRKIAKAQQKAFGVDMIRSQVFGDEVEHAHVWIWPEGATKGLKDFDKNKEIIKKNI